MNVRIYQKDSYLPYRHESDISLFIQLFAIMQTGVYHKTISLSRCQLIKCSHFEFWPQVMWIYFSTSTAQRTRFGECLRVQKHDHSYSAPIPPTSPVHSAAPLHFWFKPPDLFSFQQLLNLSGSDMVVFSLSRCWSFPLLVARWRVALFVEMCSAIQFHSSVSDESWRSIKREGTVIESQWSSSCVLLFFYFFCVHISYICVSICVCPL